MAEDGRIEASQQANTKLAVSRECVWFMVGACKVYSVIDDNDFGSPETNRDRISSERGWVGGRPVGQVEATTSPMR